MNWVKGLLLNSGIAALTLVLASCAGVTVQEEEKPKDANGESADKGIRFYEPAPFLLVYSDSKGGLTSQILWLPDTTQVMTIRPYAYFAKNNASFKFDKGVLTQSKSEADETAIPAAVVSALKTAAVAAISAANVAKQASPSVPAPYLYRIEVTSTTATLSNALRVPEVIKVTLAPAPKKN